MSLENVRNYFKEYGIEDRIIEFDTSSATVELAAKATGVDPARICKTLSFKTKDDRCVLIQMPGDKRIDNKKYRHFFGCKAKMLTPEEVVEYTGHHIGGVCAFGINNDNIDVYCDISLKEYETVFPACGSSNSAIEFTVGELFKYSNSKEFIDVVKED